MSALTIELRQFGRTRTAQPRVELVLPTALTEASQPLTVRDLLSFLVTLELDAFDHRQAEQRLLPFMTTAQIDAGAQQGKMIPKADTPRTTVPRETAIATALQAFQDGLFFLFIDDQQQDNLDTPLTLLPHSRVTLVRLIALAGG